MPFWRKEKQLLPRRDRIKNLSPNDLYNWSENLIYETGRYMNHWRKGGGENAILEAEKQIEALLEVCNEIRARERLQL